MHGATIKTFKENVVGYQQDSGCRIHYTSHSVHKKYIMYINQKTLFYIHT